MSALPADRALFDEAQPPAPSLYNPRGPRAPVAWYGGKYYYADWIIAHFPRHRLYVEPFGGAGNVLLQKHPSDAEIYNDLDGRIVNFFRVLRDRGQFEEFVRLCSLTPYSREQFVEVVEEPEPEEPVRRAWWFFVRCRQSIGGLGMSRLGPKSWAVGTRTRRGMAEGVSKFLSAVEGLESVAERFRRVMIESRPAVELIRKLDKPDVLFYCDPPYVPETRHGEVARTYRVEMSIDEHAELLAALRACTAKVILSGYPSELYAGALAGWRTAELPVKAQMSNSGQARVEVLWMNF